MCEQLERGEVEWQESQQAPEKVVDKAPEESTGEKTGDSDETAATEIQADAGPVTESEVKNEADTDGMQNKSDENTKEEIAVADVKVDTGADSTSSDIWESFAASVPKPWLKRICKRRDSAISCIKNGNSPFNEEQDEVRRMQCIRLEIISDTETPAEDKALRMQYQLEQLQAGPDSALLGSDANSLREHEIDWLCLPPASPAIAASLEQRFRKALGQKQA